jgi:predicted GTPase
MNYTFTMENFKKAHITGHAKSIDPDDYQVCRKNFIDELAADGATARCPILWNYAIDLMLRSHTRPHSVERGILLGGTTGCGKSTLFQLTMVKRGIYFNFYTAKELARIFMEDEKRFNAIISDKSKHLLIDDMGKENGIVKYGRHVEMMRDVIDEDKLIIFI